ncbi:hypothetical protein BDB01DRAFT_849192 [Pilobolus umbonatus]|nr:hypothetical protein BDB01DRAFT_849192 [Pilobolus umbonatus]
MNTPAALLFTSYSKQPLNPKILAAIENRSIKLEERLTKPFETVIKHDNTTIVSTQPISSNSPDNKTTPERQCISPKTLDNFYAIRHIPKSDDNRANDTHSQSIKSGQSVNNSQPLNNATHTMNSQPTNTSTVDTDSVGIDVMNTAHTPSMNAKQEKTKSINSQKHINPVIKSKRKAKESASSIYDQSLIEDTIKRKKRPQTKRQKFLTERPSIYQTCSTLWPESCTLGDLSHDNIQALSNLLKVRLGQAKFKMMARLNPDHTLFSVLSEDITCSQFRKHKPIRLREKRSQVPLTVVGNGKNLFRPRVHHDINCTATDTYDNVYTTPNNDMYTSNNEASPPSDKALKQTKKKNNRSVKPKRSPSKPVLTPKKRNVASSIVSVLLSDGTRAFVCEPCNKKYKNRNGLSYHLERCKNIDKHTKENTSCYCSQPIDDTNTVQCDNCQSPLHTQCALSQGDKHQCPKCADNSNSHSQVIEDTSLIKKGKNLLADLQEAQRMDSIKTDTIPTKQETSQLITAEDIFNALDIQMEDICSDIDINTQPENEILSNSQLNVWDDLNFNTGNDPWSMLSEDEPLPTLENDANSNYNINHINLFTEQTPLLFSEYINFT